MEGVGSKSIPPPRRGVTPDGEKNWDDVRSPWATVAARGLFEGEDAVL